MCSIQTTAGGGAALTEAVGAATAALSQVGQALAAGAAAEVSGVSAARLVADLLAAVDVAQAAVAVLGRRADTSGQLRPAGFVSLRGYLLDGVGLTEGHATTVVARGRAFERYPAVREAALSGEVGLATAAVITGKVDHAVSDLSGAARAARRAEGEQVMLAAAPTHSLTDLAVLGDRITDVLDPQGRAARALRRYDQRSLACARVGDHYLLRGALPLDTGAGLITLLESIVDHRYRTGSLREDEQPADGDPEGAAEARRRRHARPRLWADALDQIVTSLLDDPAQVAAGTRHGNAPHLTLLVEHMDTAQGGGGQLLVPDHHGPVHLPHETITRILCDAEIAEVHVTDATRAPGHACTRRHHGDRRGAVTLDAGSGSGAGTESDTDTRTGTGVGAGLDPHDLLERCRHVLCVGRTYRTATRAQRTALLARDRHCAFPGCSVDVHSCQAHHVREWERGGATCLSNLVLLCRAHHVLVHEGRWRLRPDPGLDPGHPHYWNVDPPDDIRFDTPLAGNALHRRHAHAP